MSINSELLMVTSHLASSPSSSGNAVIYRTFNSYSNIVNTLMNAISSTSSPLHHAVNFLFQAIDRLFTKHYRPKRKVNSD